MKKNMKNQIICKTQNLKKHTHTQKIIRILINTSSLPNGAVNVKLQSHQTTQQPHKMQDVFYFHSKISLSFYSYRIYQHKTKNNIVCGDSFFLS